MTRHVLLVILASSVIGAKALLPFWKPCPRPDPAWNDCVLDAFQHAYPYLVDGNPEYHLPVMDPLHQDKFELQKGSNLFGIAVDITNATITGLRGASVNRAKMNLATRHGEIDLHIPELNMTSDYFFAGKILGVYVNRTGDDNMTLSDVNGTLFMDYDKFKALGKDGVEHEYFNVTYIDMKLNISKVRMQFNNLFNGNQFLERQANNFMSRNWRELFNFLGSSMNKAIGDAFGRIAKDAYESLALDEMYPFKETRHSSHLYKDTEGKATVPTGTEV